MQTGMRHQMTKKGQWRNKPEKQKWGRETFLGHFLEVHNRAATTYLTLPGSGCFDLKTAIEMGVIDSNTFIIAIEREAKAAKHIREFLEALPNPYYLHDKPGGLKLFRELDTVLDGRKIDCAFFDFCGLITADMARWITTNYKHFATGCVFGYTIDGNNRKPVFVDGYGKEFRRKHGVLPYVKKAKTGYRASVDAHNYDLLQPGRQATLARKMMYDQLSAEVISLLFGSATQILEVCCYKNGKQSHPMTVIIGKITGRQAHPVFTKFVGYIDHTYPAPTYGIKNGKAKSIAQKHKMLVQELVENGVKNRGVVKLTAGKRSWLARYSHALERDPKMVEAGIKVAIRRRINKVASFKIVQAA